MNVFSFDAWKDALIDMKLIRHLVLLWCTEKLAKALFSTFKESCVVFQWLISSLCHTGDLLGYMIGSQVKTELVWDIKVLCGQYWSESVVLEPFQTCRLDRAFHCLFITVWENRPQVKFLHLWEKLKVDSTI